MPSRQEKKSKKKQSYLRTRCIPLLDRVVRRMQETKIKKKQSYLRTRCKPLLDMKVRKQRQEQILNQVTSVYYIYSIRLEKQNKKTQNLKNLI